MNVFKRRKWNIAWRILIAISLLVCVAITVLWLSAKGAWYDCGYGAINPVVGRSHLYYFSTIDDAVIFSIVTEDFTDPKEQTTQMQGFHQGWVSGDSRLWGFGMSSLGQIGQYGKIRSGFGYVWQDKISYSGYTENSRILMMPFWFVFAAAASIPAYSAVAWIWRRSRRRQARGLCKKCGYDLRAHAPGSNCPECGTPIAPSSPPASAQS
jgi:hypothetical protein